MSTGAAVLSAAREVQIPLLTALFIGACAAKARRAIRARAITAALVPSAMFPLRLRRPASIAIYTGELSLGAGLILTAGRAGAGIPATTVRAGAALMFAIALAALNELRARHPGAGCGCFGDLSEAPVSCRTLARTALLCVAAVASIGVPPLHMPVSMGQAGLLLATGATELLLLATLSPEVGEIMVRLGYAEPCAVRALPVERTLTALRASAPWRRYARHLTALEPSDIWREGCWRFAVFPAAAADREFDVVFAVYVQSRRPPVRVAVLDAAPDAAHEAPAAPRATVPGPRETVPAMTPQARAPHAGAPQLAPAALAPAAPAPAKARTPAPASGPVPTFTPVIPIFTPVPTFVPATMTAPAAKTWSSSETRPSSTLTADPIPRLPVPKIGAAGTHV